MRKKKRGEAKSKEDDDTDTQSSIARLIKSYGSAGDTSAVHVDRPAVDGVQHELDMKHALEQQPLERDRLLLHMRLGTLSVRQRERYWSLCAEHATAERAAAIAAPETAAAPSPSPRLKKLPPSPRTADGKTSRLSPTQQPRRPLL